MHRTTTPSPLKTLSKTILDRLRPQFYTVRIILTIAILIAIGLWTLPTEVQAHLPPNFDFFEGLPPSESLRAPQVEWSNPEYNQEAQEIITELSTASCERLEALPDQVKNSMFSAIFLLQPEGILSKVIGPDCMFLGRVEAVATVEDAALLIDPATPERLYSLPDRNIVFVSDTNNNTIAYGFPISEYTEPLTYFVARRNQALIYAGLAKGIAPTKTAATIESSSSATIAQARSTSSVSTATQTGSSAPQVASSQATSLTTVSVPRSQSVLSAQRSIAPTPTSTPVSINSLSSSSFAFTESSAPVTTTSSSLPRITDNGAVELPPEETGIPVWVYGLVVIIVGGVLYMVYRYRNRQNVLSDIRAAEAEKSKLQQ